MNFAKTTTTISCVLVIVVAVLIGRQFWHGESKSAAETSRIIRLTTARNASEGWRLAEVALAETPDNPLIASAAADAAVAADEFPDALKILNRFASQEFIASDIVVEQLRERGYHRILMSLLDSRIRSNPRDFEALLARGELRLIQGLRSEAIQDFTSLLEQGTIPPDDLVFLCSCRELREDTELLNKALDVDAGYAPTHIGLGAHAAFEGRLEDARQHLRRGLELDDDLDDGWAALGLVHYRLGDLQKSLPRWKRDVLNRNVRHPDVGYVLAWFAEQSGEEQQAVGILAQALENSPSHRACCQLLSTILARDPDGVSDAEFLARRAGLVHDLEVHMHEVLFGDRSQAAFKTAAEICARLGQAKLAKAWASGLGSALDQDFYEALSQTSQQVDSELLAILTRWHQDSPVKNAKDSEGTGPEGVTFAESQFELADVSANVGLTSKYYGGFDTFDSGLWVYQGFGGGVAVLDFDNDDRPDLFFTQASQWGSSASLPIEQQDLLYRARNSEFQLATASALSPEHEFGQGASIGDVDRDGFDDIYVANIGSNRLLINNGDGTFESRIMPGNPNDETNWTSSCLLADLDNDGLDDIYDVQYVIGPEPFRKVCRSGAEQLVRSCLPSLFAAAADRVLYNSGDSSFEDQSMSSGLTGFQGRGLGIIAADLDGVPGLEVFVSNDMTANHYFQIDGTNGRLRFQEQAELKGLARNGEGQLEACMGIAAADISNDGLTDVFVTNFYEETNSYYEALSSGFFRDQTVVAGLGITSRKKLGFGTQAMDFDLDGDLDLLVANGHVDNYEHMNAPWKMTADLMENFNNGRFRRRPETDAGTYGETPVLGRAVARLDWNRDGLPDAAVTHLDRGPALLSNKTETSGNFISIRLVGTTSNRPAIGTNVVARFGDSEQTIQQNSGDGYYCSNERIIMIGFERTKVLEELEVCWPSGTSTKFERPQTGTRYIAVEGRPKLYSLVP